VSAIVIDGQGVANQLVAELGLSMAGVESPPTLATVLVGDDPGSQIYIRSKIKRAAEAGIGSRHIGLPASVSQSEVEEVVRALAADASIDGILVQLPLPDGLDAEPVLSLIPPMKDVDGLTTQSLGRLVRNLPGHVPCTPRGVMELLRRYDVPIRGRKAVVLGRSTLVGLPMALLLAQKGIDATVTVAHSRTADLAGECRAADIIVAAVGVPGIVTADWVKPGACVIDVGVSRVDGKIRGDVAYSDVAEVAGWITPMPRGTGPMTVACLMENTVDAWRMRRG
jgi:methylenetetrahydrofolate dehydrogenase (NADP+)/methenyltetrahydrofolate cyclohydrolase